VTLESREPVPAAALYGDMTTNDDTTILVLNRLLTANKDAEQGYQAAADAVAVPVLVELFEGYALQRGKFVVELGDRIRTLRGTPEQAGTALGALQRGWMGLKAAMAENDTRALLEECESADAMAARLYGAALKEQNIDPSSRQLIQRQYELVQAAHDRVRQLRDSSVYVAT
jgi:uncharacterized protein (TIGR02284 family)